MLFLCDLPVDEEPEDSKETLKSSNKIKYAVVIGSIIILLSVIIFSIIGLLKLQTPKNVSPYCLLMRNENKVCKIHDKKHEGKDLKELIISEEEMAFHQQLYDEIVKGAYFDGRRLYKEEDAKEILQIKEAFSEEKASLFERYLSSDLTEKEKERYNFLIEELDTLEISITKLNIKESDKDEPSKEELAHEVALLKKELDELKSPQVLLTAPVEENLTSVESMDLSIATEEEQKKEQADTQGPSSQDRLIYISQPSRDIKIPKDIESAATIKKSSLYY